VADDNDAEGEQVIQAMMRSYFDSGYEIRAVLRTLFHSDYFESQARYARVKGPVELLVGALRLAGSYRKPTLGAHQLAYQTFYMGQGLLQPPSVEGWHEGLEWIDSGSLLERLNFIAKELSNVSNPGVRAIIDRLATEDGGTLTPAQLVDQCLDLMGPLAVDDETRATLVAFTATDGDLNLKERQPCDASEQRVGNLLRMIVSTREFQLA
jgi:uncharacterized protein (DUF1800 family)